jgi:hypothetical protein
MAARRNATSDHLPPNLQKALLPIPIILTIPIPGIQTCSSPIAKPRGGSRANLSPAPWLSKEVYKCQKPKRQCTCCSSGDHKTCLVPNIHGNMQEVKALVTCGARIIFILPSILTKLKLPYKPAFTSTLAW